MGGTLRHRLRALAALLGAAGALSAIPAAAAIITVAAPRDGAVLGTGDVTMAGKQEGGKDGSMAITLNGNDLPAVPVKGGRFSAALTLRPGLNRLTLRSAAASRDVTYEVRAGAGSYRFHSPYEEGECAECHGAGKALDRALCHSCHDAKDRAPFLHGPVGAGQCTVCHDPHGSPYAAFVTAPGARLCQSCHDQSSSQSHMKNSRSRSCEECHNPHGSEKKYFLY